MRTFSPKPEDITREWYVVDAEDQVLGRLATRIATVLRGKHKPIWAPHVDVGDHVVVINADKVRLAGEKGAAKVYHRHSGYPGGLTSVPFAQMMQKQPEQVLEKAVKGMLPKNRLGRAMGTKLRVYAGSEHPHAAQDPKPLPDHV